MVDSTRYLIIHRDFLVHISHSAGLDVHHVSFFIETFGSHPEGGAGRQDDNQSRAFCVTFSNELSSVGETSLSLLKVGRVKPTKDCQFVDDCGGKKLCTFAQTITTNQQHQQTQPKKMEWYNPQAAHRETPYGCP